MARLKGNRTPELSFTIGETDTDLGDYVVSFQFEDGEGEALTISDHDNGVRPVQLTVTYAAEFGAATAFGFHYTNAGATGVDYVVKYDGATTTSATNPEFTGTCVLPPKPYWGVSAGTEEQTFEVTIQLDSYNQATS